MTARASRRTRGRGPARIVLLLPSGGRRARRPVACVRAARPCSLRPRLAQTFFLLLLLGALGADAGLTAGRVRRRWSCTVSFTILPMGQSVRAVKSSLRACSRRWLPRSCPLPRARVLSPVAGARAVPRACCTWAQSPLCGVPGQWCSVPRHAPNLPRPAGREQGAQRADASRSACPVPLARRI